ncbi:MAG: biopolymer transporter ExbD [Rhizobiaceae bacterium]|nr:biopolymer transporter ExbD [Rhizobiaceae bacterium]
MRLHRTYSNRHKENTIPLINVVFLMLVFFLIAGTIAPSNDKEISPVSASLERQTPLEEAISMRADGALYFRGAGLDILAPLPSQLADKSHLIIYPDQKASAQIFAEKIATLRKVTGKPISVLIERKTK